MAGQGNVKIFLSTPGPTPGKHNSFLLFSSSSTLYHSTVTGQGLTDYF